MKTLLQGLTLLLGLLAISTGAQSAECRIECVDIEKGCTLGGQAIPPQHLGGWSECSSLHGKAEGSALLVWYFDGSRIVSKVFRENGPDIEDVLQHAANASAFTGKRRAHSAGSPFDSGASKGDGSSGAGIGLPYGSILPPKSVSSLINTPAGVQAGTLTLVDAQSGKRKTLPIDRGKVDLTRAQLAQNTTYDYQFVASSGQRFTGRFTVASGQTARDVETDTASAMQAEAAPNRHRDMFRAQVLIEYDLRWDALQTLINGGGA